MFDGQAWFEGDLRLGEGEEFDELEVLRLSPPWSVRVRWKGVEFDVDLFARDRVVQPDAGES